MNEIIVMITYVIKSAVALRICLLLYVKFLNTSCALYKIVTNTK